MIIHIGWDGYRNLEVDPEENVVWVAEAGIWLVDLVDEEGYEHMNIIRAKSLKNALLAAAVFMVNNGPHQIHIKGLENTNRRTWAGFGSRRFGIVEYQWRDNTGVVASGEFDDEGFSQEDFVRFDDGTTVTGIAASVLKLVGERGKSLP